MIKEYKTIKEVFVHSMENYAHNTLILEKPSHKDPYKNITFKEALLKTKLYLCSFSFS